MPISTFDPSTAETPESLAAWIKQRALNEGFDQVGITNAIGIRDAGQRLESFLNEGHHGEMHWLAEKAEWRKDPAQLWPEARSIIMLGMNYGPATNPLDKLADSSHAAISVYAHGNDYHDIVKKKLKIIAGEFARRTGADVKVFVDTAPVMEKALAQSAGLGWQGKHTNLVSRSFGSWLFLGSIFTTADLVIDAVNDDHCGGCSRCVEICPTDAFTLPYQLDATRCISYLTIESKSQIPKEFRQAIGNRIYGCDDCLAVCPWNKFAQASDEIQFASRFTEGHPSLIELIELDDANFRILFRKSPIKRIGRDRFIRNVLIAAGNSGSIELVDPVQRRLSDASSLVRGMAAWALARLLINERQRFNALRLEYRSYEYDMDVIREWETAYL